LYGYNREITSYIDLVDELVFGFDETEERIIVVTKELDSALNTIACFLCNF